ncbi:MAG: hypothetical protein AAB440_00760 [Patescibacteria group bacterium]
MDVKVVPAVLPTSRDDLERQLSELSGVTDEVQLNIVDGKFASPATWPYVLQVHDLEHLIAQHRMLPGWGIFRFEIELQVKQPEDVIGAWIAVGATRLTIHIDSIGVPDRILRDLEVQYGHDKDFAPDLLSVGFALGVDTDFNVVEPYIDRLDYVQFMGVSRLGKHGEPFESKVVDRIKEFRKKHPSVGVQVDGGVSRATAPALLSAGVSRLVVGSDLWRAEDKLVRYQEIKMLAEQYGIYE